jgi:NTE family protein
LIAGLESEGVRVSQADLIVGTSAGSIVGSQLACGRNALDLYQSQLTLAERRDRPQPEPVDMAPILAQFMKLYTSDAPLQQLRAEMGRFALAAKGDEDEWIAGFSELELGQARAWPERDFACTAIDIEEGSFVVWTRDSGVPLLRAVASSCAVPGIVPPVTIHGRRYMDGGVGSTTNATVAKGYDRVLVVSVISLSRARTSSAASDIAERARRRFGEELDTVRASGSSVDVIVGNERFMREVGVNVMDFTRRRVAAEIGFEQGQAEADRIAGFWSH